MASLKPLQLVKKRYRIMSQAGKGGFGTVYRTEDTLLGLPVALKAIDETSILDLRREARHLACLKHVGVPSYLDFFEERGRWYLVMEWVEGGHVSTAHPLSVRQVIWIGKQVCDILFYLHALSSPVIHRDIKPSNIMLSASQQLYLVDFGISCHPGPNKMIAGSQGYAAPEQWERGQMITPKADIYSLGMTLRQLLTGQAPAEQNSTTHKASSQETHIPTGWFEQPEYCQLARLLAHMTAHLPDERPDVREVERELAGLHLTLKRGTHAQQ